MAGSAIEQVRKARIDAERRRIQKQKLEYVVADQRAEYERKTEAIKRLSQSWIESNRLRDFATALQAKSLAPNLSDNLRRELEAMIDWTVRRALRLNPLSHLERTIQEVKSRRVSRGLWGSGGVCPFSRPCPLSRRSVERVSLYTGEDCYTVSRLFEKQAGITHGAARRWGRPSWRGVRGRSRRAGRRAPAVLLPR